jgi:hypothetical protein
VLSIHHFMSLQFKHHDLLLHISLNIGRVRKIQWYSVDLHLTNFISRSLFSIFIKTFFSATGGRKWLSRRRRWWFPPPSPRVHLHGLWILYSGSNRVHPLCLLILIQVVARLTQAHRVPYDLDHPLMPRQLMSCITWLWFFPLIPFSFIFS